MLVGFQIAFSASSKKAARHVPRIAKPAGVSLRTNHFLMRALEGGKTEAVFACGEGVRVGTKARSKTDIRPIAVSARVKVQEGQNVMGPFEIEVELCQASIPLSRPETWVLRVKYEANQLKVTGITVGGLAHSGPSKTATATSILNKLRTIPVSK